MDRQPDPELICRCNSCPECGGGVYMELRYPKDDRGKIKPRKPVRWADCDHLGNDRRYSRYNVKRLSTRDR